MKPKTTVSQLHPIAFVVFLKAPAERAFSAKDVGVKREILDRLAGQQWLEPAGRGFRQTTASLMVATRLRRWGGDIILTHTLAVYAIVEGLHAEPMTREAIHACGDEVVTADVIAAFEALERDGLVRTRRGGRYGLTLRGYRLYEVMTRW